MRRETKSTLLQAIFVLLIIIGIIWYVKHPRQTYIKLKTLKMITIQPRTAIDGIFKYTFNNSISEELDGTVAVLKSFTPDDQIPVEQQNLINGLIINAPPFIVKVKEDASNAQISRISIISNSVPQSLMNSLPQSSITIVGTGEVWFTSPPAKT
jgi:hypothetical protein